MAYDSDDYNIIAEYKGEKEVIYKRYGSYDGEFILVTEKNGVLRIYKGYYGSCSGCDSYEANFGWGEEKNEEKVAEFVSEYEPFLERKISELTYEDLVDGIRMNNKDTWDFTEKEQDKMIKELADMYDLKEKHSTNERAKEIVGLRLDGDTKNVIAIDFPCELGYHCPVCEYEQEVGGNYDERLQWSEYDGFIWCEVCNKDYPSVLCMPDIDKAIDIYLDIIEEVKGE